MESPDLNFKKIEANLDALEVEAEKRTINPGDMSILEHVFMGGSEKASGVLWDENRALALLEKGGDVHEVEEALLTPIALFDSSEQAIEKLNEKRRLNKRRTGFLTVIDINQQVELSFRHLRPYIELGDVGSNRRVSGEWRVGLVDGEENEVDSSELSLDPTFSKNFTLEKDAEGKGKILKLKLPSPIAIDAVQPKEQNPIRISQDLSPFEHVTFGSSTDIEVEGKKINVNSQNLKQLMQDPVLRKNILSPTNLIKGRRDLEGVRTARKGRVISGSISPFQNTYLQRYLSEQIYPAFELGSLDEAGQLASFEVFLLDAKDDNRKPLPEDPSAVLIIREEFEGLMEYVGEENGMMKFRIKQNASETPDKI